MQNITNEDFSKIGGLTGMGVTPTSNGKQVYSGSQGTYLRNEYNVGTPQYYTDYSFTPTTNPVTSGAPVEADVNALGNDINSLTNTSNDANKLIQDRMDALERRRTEEIAQIKAEYAGAADAQEKRQGKDYAGRATGLVTSGGGFLGATQSQEGVLQNLKATFEGEKNALMAKRDAAVREAQNAYDDKQFDLARAKIAEAKDTEKELYQRQKDNADALLAASREKRAQQEFEMGITDKKAEAFALMDDAAFAKIDQNEIDSIDKAYYPGFTKAYRDAEKAAAAAKTAKETTDAEMKMYEFLSKVPAGTKVTINGKTYRGMKQPSSASTKGIITNERAKIAGLPPSVVGMNEKDLILSLELNRPAAWFTDLMKANPPKGYFSGPTGQQVEAQPWTQAQIQSEWDGIRNSEDMISYRNTVKLDNRNSINSGDADLEKIIDGIAGSVGE